jgi:HK97 family phage major capsid protein
MSEPTTPEQFNLAMDAIVAAAKERNFTDEEAEQYEKYEKGLKVALRDENILKRHEAWQAPRVSLRPPSVVQGNRDDGRYAFDKFLRGDKGAAKEIANYDASQGSREARDRDDVRAEAKLIRWAMSPNETYAQTETTTGGGYLVPTITENVMVKIRKAFGGISAKASHINTGNGDPLNFPTIDDTANSSAIAAINAAPGSAGADLVFGQVTLGAFKYAATGTGQLGLKVPRELLDDALFDVAALVTEMLGIRLARKMAADYAVGVGTTAPSGLYNATSVTTAARVLSTGLVQATANQQLEAFIHNLDPSYVDDNCVWVMNWATHGVISGFQDTTTRPLMQPYAQAGLGSPPAYTLLGFPVVIDQGSPAFSLTSAANPAAVNTAFLAFGNIGEAYLIRDVQGIGIAVDPYTGIGSNQVLYFGYARTDAKVKNAAAYELLPGYHA